METGLEKELLGYPTPEELWNLTFAKVNAWRDRFAAVPYEDKGGSHLSRYYQDTATERVMLAHEQQPFPLDGTESPEYTGRALAALAADPNVLTKSGAVLTAGDLAREYGFTDIDGSQPEAFRLPPARPPREPGRHARVAPRDAPSDY